MALFQLAPSLQSITPIQQARFAIAVGSDTLFASYADEAAQDTNLGEFDHLMAPGNGLVPLWQYQVGDVSLAAALAQLVALLSSIGIVWDRLNRQAYSLYIQDGLDYAYSIATDA